MAKGEAITAGIVSKAVENAQRKVEGYNFDIRKQLLDFDNVANDQRKVIYQQRNELMETEDVSATITEMQQDVVRSVMDQFIPPQSIEDQWQVEDLEKCLDQEFGQKLPIRQWLQADKTLHAESLRQRLIDHIIQLHAEKERELGAENMRHLEKVIMLNVLDSNWKEHLATMDYVRQSIHLRGYAQKDPKQEYKREAFDLFTSMLDSIKREVVSLLAKTNIQRETDISAVDEGMRKEAKKLEFHHDAADVAAFRAAEPVNENLEHNSEPSDQPHTYVREHPKVGRNDVCPCGSGRKYKQCHGKIVNINS